MSYPINYPTPQGANIQIFNPNAYSSTSYQHKQTWIKPQGVSFVFFTLIGAGGAGGDADGDGTYGGYAGGGGSGAVLNCLVPAFLVPDQLQVVVWGKTQGASGLATEVVYQQKNGTGYTLLSAGGGLIGDTAIVPGGAIADVVGLGGAGGTPSNSAFRALGISNGTSGQTGADGLTGVSLPTDTFLVAGTSQGNGLSTAHYGYTTGTSGRGYGIISPIINSVPNRMTGGETSAALAFLNDTGFGCGGNGAESASAYLYGYPGGPGLAIIISW